MEKSRRMLGIISVILLLVLVITNVILFRLYIEEIREREEVEKFLSTWYCIEGTHNTMLFYNYTYNISMNREIYDFLTIDICGDTIYGNNSWNDNYLLMKNWIPMDPVNKS